MNTLLPLEDYEADPEFISLSPQDKDKFYSNYYSTAQEQAQDEDAFNQILKYRADRTKSALQTAYLNSYPEDTQIDPEKATANEAIKPLFDKAQNDYAELNFNQTQEVKSVKADDMEDSTRSLTYKPFVFQGKRGYSVKYPNGDIESIRDIESESQLTDYLRKNRLDKFSGKREGVIDSNNPLADNEFDMIYDKIRNTDSGTKGYFNGIRSRWAKMSQGFDIADITKDQEYINSPNNIQELEAKWNAKIDNPNIDEEERRELRDQKDMAMRQAAEARANTPEYNNNLQKNKEYVSSALRGKYVNLAKDMIESQKIRGTRVLEQYNDHIAATAKEKRGELKTFGEYFLQNPADAGPYLTAIATSALPDMAAIIGTASATGIATGSPLAAGAAAGAVGFQLEYTGTLLGDMEARAAEEGKKLTDPGVIESYIEDSAFVANVQNKALARASIIGATDAITGGASELIVKTINGGLRRAGAAMAVDAVSGAGGEIIAQAATQDKLDWTGILNEGFGELAGAPMTVARGVYQDIQEEKKKPKNVPEAMAAGKDAVESYTASADYRSQAYERLQALKEQTGRPAPAPEDSQSTEKSDPANKDIPVEPAPTIVKSPAKAAPVTPEEFNKNLDGTLKDIDAEQTARVAAAKDSFDRKAPSENYSVNGVQKGFNDKDEYVPMYQLVTIRDPEHYFDGSTIAVPLTDGVASEEAIQKAISDKAKQEETDKAKLAQMDASGAVRYDNRPTEEEAVTSQSTEKAPSLIFKAVDFYYNLIGKKPGTVDPSKVAADKALRNSLTGGVFSLLSDTGSFNRVMQATLDSNYDPSAQGRLMGVMGLTANDSKARVLTNVLGNFWTVSGNNYSDEFNYNGALLSEAIDSLYRQEANVDSIYDMDEAEINGITKKDLLLNMAPDGMMTDSEGYEYPVQSQAYTYMDAEEAAKRFNSQYKATVIRAPEWNDDVNNKIIEAKKMKRPGMVVTKLSDVPGTPQQKADAVIRGFANGFVMKDAKGDNGRNIFYSSELTGVSLAEKIKQAEADGRADDIYFETMVFRRKENTDFNEHRVHIYVDKKGKAHAFRNLTFNKRETLYNQMREGNSNNPDYDALVILPSDSNDAKIIALQEYAEKIMSGKGFADMIFGLDIGETRQLTESGTLKEGNTIFEANALSYGMSGWLGNPLSMSEIISEMTGKPSVMAGMYEVAKTGLSKEELSDIKNRIDEGMPAEFASHPEYWDAVNKGVAMFNRYIPSFKWLSAMKNMFSMPVEFLKKLYGVISGVFKGSVDRRFEAQQRIQLGAKKINDRRAPKIQSTEKPKNDDILVPPSKSSLTLREYVNRVLTHPNLTQAQRSVLSYVLKSGGKKNLDEIKVSQTSLPYNYYNTSKQKVGIRKGNVNPRVAVHEIVHAVTSDLIDVNMKKAHLMIDQVNYFDYEDNAAINNIYQFVTDPRNEKEMLDAGIDKDFINLAKTYYQFISDLGFGGPDSKLGAGAASYAFQEANPKIPYGAVNMDEFVTETLTKPDFQKRLAKIPARFGNSRSMLSSIMQMISRMLGIPFKHGGTMLYQAVKESLAIIKDTPMSNDIFAYQEDGTWVMRPSNPESEVTTINGRSFVTSEVPNAAAQASVAEGDAQLKSVELQAEIESIEQRISQLRSQAEELSKDNQARLKAIEPVAKNLPQMREIFIDDLDEKLSEEKPEAKYKMTARRLEMINKLQNNKYYAVESLGEWINDSRITDAQADILLDSMEHVFEMSEDPENLSTNRIKYYVNVLQSMSDGGPPIGFKHIAPKMFMERQKKILEYIRDNPSKGKKGRVHLQAPIGDWRREFFFGIFRGKLGTQTSLPSEIAYMGLSDQGHQFLKDLMGYYKDNIDLQAIEETAVKNDFYATLRAAFGKTKMTQLNAKRIGVVARLTQYETTKPNPKDQILSRLNQVVSGIEVEKAYKKDDGELSNVALKQILGSADLSTMADESAIISFLESKLSPAEKAVLEKLRSIGRTYMPVLQTVKAITKNTALQEFENYVHDMNVTPSEEATEQTVMKAFTSMADILHDRKGINVSENTTYAELDITAIADKQIKSTTYEKHTGMQRYMLANALAQGSPLTEVLDADTDLIKKPVTNRLRQLLVNYHNAMTTSQSAATGFWGLVESATNLYVGTKIIGVNAWIKNVASSTIARFSLQSLDGQALADSMSYDNNRGEIDQYLKRHFPSQWNRTNEYDIIEESKARYTIQSKVRRNIDIGHAPFMALIKTFPSMPREAIQKLNDTLMSRLSNVSNGLPERYSAHAIWTAAYVHFMKKNRTVTDMADFLARKPVDRRAANDASDFVSNALGYTQDKASKGTYWNAGTPQKRILSKMFSVFRQQSTGLAIDFQNNAQKAARLFMSGNFDEANKALKLARTSLANSISFRGLTLVLSGSMVWGGLDRFFNASDDEEKKKQLLEAKRKYTENANRNNLRDFMSETILMLAPVATAAMFVETAVAGSLDASKIVGGFTPKGIEVETKQNLQAQVDDVRNQITELEKVANKKFKLNQTTDAEDEAIEKLDLIASQLTEKLRFKYFPSQSDKAFLSAFGSYGIAEEFLNKAIIDMIEDDLDDDELKARVKQSLKDEFSYNDPLAGAGYGLDQINDMLGFARKLIPTEHIPKRKEENIPNSLFWMEYLKAGQNPKVIVERARAEIAKEAVRARIAAEKKAARIESRWADKHRN